MIIPISIIDTFTTQRFKGNPTAVCLLSSTLEDSRMHSIAMEINLPVTAFVEMHDANNVFKIRYFTVTGEIPACGHATLASSKIVLDITKKNVVQFETKQGILLEADFEGDIIYMKYPRYEMTPFSVSSDTLKSLGVQRYLAVGFCRELETLFIEMDPMTLRGIIPDFKLMKESMDLIKEIVVTSVSDHDNYDFLLRSFCPWIGIDEDPVTGSVHSVLAGYWGNKLHKKEMIAFQASERGGEVYVRNGMDVVQIGGKTVRVLKGEMEI